MSLMARFAARTPEEAARRRFGLWAGAALIVFLPLWWFAGADIVAAILRPVVGLILRLFGLTGAITPVADGGWVIGTALTRAGTPIDYTLPEATVRRLLLGVPLWAAFMIAPPRASRPWRAIAISVAVLVLVFALSIAAVTWGGLAPLLNPVPGSGVPLDQPPLNPVAAQVAQIGQYLASSIAPLLTALLLWATLNPAGLNTLVAEIKDQPAG